MPRSLRRRICLIAAVTLPMLLISLNVAFGQRGGPVIIQRPGQPQVIIQQHGGPKGPIMVQEGGRPVGFIQQPNGPNGPVIVHQPPPRPMVGQQMVWVTVWSCTRCGREVSRGENPPVGVCPHCQANFKQENNRPVQQKVQKTDDRLPVASIISAIAAVTIFVLGGILFIVLVITRCSTLAIMATAGSTLFLMIVGVILALVFTMVGGSS